MFVYYQTFIIVFDLSFRFDSFLCVRAVGRCWRIRKIVTNLVDCDTIAPELDINIMIAEDNNLPASGANSV